MKDPRFCKHCGERDQKKLSKGRFRCKLCSSMYNAGWTQRNIHKHKSLTDRWRKNNPEKVKISNQKYAKKNRTRETWRAAKYNDTRRGLSTCSLAEWLILVECPCHYCGHKSSGCDRVDNSKGHEYGNILPSCSRCNCTRGDWYTVEEMILFIAPAIRKVLESRAQNP